MNRSSESDFLLVLPSRSLELISRHHSLPLRLPLVGSNVEVEKVVGPYSKDQV